MPRKTGVRRFDPWGGVSQSMIECEAKAVEREHEEYLLLSLSDLRERLNERLGKYRQADETVRPQVTKLAEREGLAIQCMLVRDLYFVLEVYEHYLRSQTSTPTTRIDDANASTQELPFSEWLFGQ